MEKLKILYAGSPLASSLVLKNLVQNAQNCGFEICAVLTNPPSSRGRHKELVSTEVANEAKNHQIPILEFDHIKSEAREAVQKFGADLLVSFDFGRIFGPKFLNLFRLGGINLHPGSLPRYRGCTPVPSAILNGDKKIEVCVQKLALKTDEGDLLARGEIELDGTETTLSLMDGDGKKSAVCEIGSKLLLDVLSETAKMGVLPKSFAQTGEANYTPLLKKDDGEIDWNESAQKIERKIRAYTPWPGCFTEKNGVRLKIIRASAIFSEKGTEKSGEVFGFSAKNENPQGIKIQCGDGVLFASELQWEKKKAVDWKSFLNGSRDFVGSILGK